MLRDADRLPLALLLLRLTLGVFLLQWAVEKFVVPATTVAILRNFYGLALDAWIAPLIGSAQLVLATALLLGVVPRLSYGLATLMHLVTVIVTIPRLLAPWNPVSNHFFIAGVPILAGLFTLYLLREADRWTLPHIMARRSAPG